MNLFPPVFKQTFQVLYKGRPIERNIQNIYEARAICELYSVMRDVLIDKFVIRPNKTSVKASEQECELLYKLGKDNILTESKILSGKGLKYKTVADKLPVKYTPHQYEPNGDINLLNKRVTKTGIRKLRSKLTNEVIEVPIMVVTDSVDNCKGIYFFRSMERNKGISSIRKEKDKNLSCTGQYDFKLLEHTNNNEIKLPTRTRHEIVRALSKTHTSFSDLYRNVRSIFKLSQSQTRQLISESI